ncbi:hypothetical protein [Serratia marcescens]|nr:hypothetical protein [Serratia marcescens]
MERKKYDAVETEKRIAEAVAQLEAAAPVLLKKAAAPVNEVSGKKR